MQKSTTTAFWGSFAFLTIENGFREAVVVALTPKKRAPRLQTITPRQREAKKMDLQQGTTTPLHPCERRPGHAKKAQRQKKRNGKGFFSFFTDRKWVWRSCCNCPNTKKTGATTPNHHATTTRSEKTDLQRGTTTPLHPCEQRPAHAKKHNGKKT
jgi:hypothetical protein